MNVDPAGPVFCPRLTRTLASCSPRSHPSSHALFHPGETIVHVAGRAAGLPPMPLPSPSSPTRKRRCQLVRRKGKRNVSFFSLFTFFSFPYAMERGGYAMDTRRPIAARETKRLTTECGATLDKSWAARRQGTPAAQPVRWRRAPAALQNLPQRAQRVANPPPPSPRPTATRTRRAALYISAAYRKYR